LNSHADRLLQKILAFLEVHSDTNSEKEASGALEDSRMLRSWAMRPRDGFEFWGEDGDDVSDEDIVPQELLDAVERLDRKEYEVEEMLSEAFLDLDQIVPIP
jgi:hypothetical protein